MGRKMVLFGEVAGSCFEQMMWSFRLGAKLVVPVFDAYSKIHFRGKKRTLMCWPVGPLGQFRGPTKSGPAAILMNTGFRGFLKLPRIKLSTPHGIVTSRSLNFQAFKLLHEELR